MQSSDWEIPGLTPVQAEQLEKIRHAMNEALIKLQYSKDQDIASLTYDYNRQLVDQAHNYDLSKAQTEWDCYIQGYEDGKAGRAPRYPPAKLSSKPDDPDPGAHISGTATPLY